MKKILCLVVMLCGLSASFSIASYYDMGGVKYDAYFRYDKWVKMNMLVVSFYEQKPTAEQTEFVLKQLIETSAKLHPDKDIMGKAVYIPRNNEYQETPLQSKDGSTTIYYVAKVQKVLTDKEKTREN